MNNTAEHAPRPHRHGHLRRAFRVARWCCWLPLLLLALLLVLITSEGSRLAIANWTLQRYAADHVAVRGLRSTALSHWAAERVTIYDRGATWLTLEQPELVWAPTALLSRRLLVHRLTATALDILPRADTGNRETARDNALTTPWPAHLPVISLRFFRIGEVLLREQTVPAFGREPRFSVEGSLRLKTGLHVSLEGEVLGPTHTVFQLSSQVNSLSSALIEGQVNEAAAGPLGTYLKLPREEALSMRFAANLSRLGELTRLHIDPVRLPISAHRYQVNAAILFTETGLVHIEDAVISVDDSSHHYLRGSGNAEAIDVELQLDRFPLDALRPWLDDPRFAPLLEGHLSARLAVFGPARQPQVEGDLKFLSQWRGRPLSLDASGETDGSALRLDHALLRSGETRLSASGTADITQRDARLKINAEQLSTRLLREFGLPIPPYVDLHADSASGSLSGTLQNPDFSLAVKGEARYRALEAQLEGQINKRGSTLHIAELSLQSPEGQARAEGEIALASQSRDTALHIQLRQVRESVLPLIDLPALPHTRARAEGQVSLLGNIRAPTVRVDAIAEGEFRAVPATLSVDGAWTGKGLKLDEVTLFSRGESVVHLRGDFARSGRRLDLALEIAPEAATFLREFGLRDQSRLAASLQVRGSLAAPRLEGQLQYTEALPSQSGEGEIRNADYLVNATLRSVGKRTQISADISRDGSILGDIQVESTLDGVSAVVFRGAPFSQMPLDADLAGALDLSSLAFFIDPELTRFGGRIHSQLQLRGTPERPSLQGLTTISRGEFNDYVNDLRIDEILCAVEADGQRLYLSQCSARDGHQGNFALSGNLQLPYAATTGSIDLSLQAQGVNVLKNPSMDGEISGTLNARGDFRRIDVSGELEVSPLNALIENGASSAIPQLTVNEHYYAEDLDGETPSPRSIPWPETHLDVRVMVGDKAYLRGRGIEAELQGKLRLTGTPEDVEAQGTLKTVRGSFEVFGKKFVLVGGELTFVNNRFALDFEGQYSKQEQIVRARLSGTNEGLKLDLSATPALPEDQILAFMLFGQQAQNISPLEALQLAAAVQKLRGGESFFDPISKARDILAVDTISLDTTENEAGERGVNLELGKYLNERVYLELSSSDNNSQPWKGRLEIELTPRLTLESSTGGKTGIEGAKLKWRRDY